MHGTISKAAFIFRSLRARIVLLAAFTCLLLAGAAISFFFFLQSSRAATLNAAERHLIVVAAALREDYTAEARKGGYPLSAVSPLPGIAFAGSPDPRVPPPPPAAPPRKVSPLENDPLALLTSHVLRRENGIEGGFYSVKADSLAGYAFPTHEGPGDRKEIPGKERPVITDLAREATSNGTTQTQQFRGPHDAILFVAVSIREAGKITGAAWLMERMPGVDAGRSKQLLLGSLGFGAAAITCALLTFFITSEVNSGVSLILARLGLLEGSLDERSFRGLSAKPQLAEFEQVLERVDLLSNSLKQKIENERALEDEIRHRQRLSALGQFAAGVAHELRNPLATIRLRTQMSQRASEISAVSRNSTVVLNEVERLDKMIERLLYFARPISLELQLIPLAQLCSQTILQSWSTRLETAGIFAQCTGDEKVMLYCDPSKIRQVLDNLMENAMQSLEAVRRADAQLELAWRATDDLVVVEVSDNGSGLEADAKSRALEPFFTTKDTGTGLGLSISYEIVQAHGGDLRLADRPEGGAIATLTFPRSRASISTLREPEKAEA